MTHHDLILRARRVMFTLRLVLSMLLHAVVARFARSLVDCPPLSPFINVVLYKLTNAGHGGACGVAAQPEL